jgi:allantoin racemase
MRVAIINPNTTVSMTGRIVAAATAAAGPETTIIGSQSVMAPTQSRDRSTGRSLFLAF